MKVKWEGSECRGGDGDLCSRCFEPILLLHYPSHLVEGLALILVQTEDRRPVLQPFFGHVCLLGFIPGFTPEWRGPRSWVAVVQPGGGRLGRREALEFGWQLSSCLGQYVFMDIGSGRQGYGRRGSGGGAS